MPERLRMTGRISARNLPPNAVYVGRGSKWANPWRFMSRDALARVPALDGSAWEWESRISAAGMSHAYHHPDGKITPHMVRYMTLAECNEMYRQALTAPTNEIHLTDPFADYDPKLGRTPWLTVEDARRDLSGRDLVCRCPLHRACHIDVLFDIINPKKATK